MSFDMLIKEVESLAEPERRRLMAFMVALDDRGNAGYAQRLAEKIDDTTPERWLTPEQCARELGLPDAGPRIELMN